MKFYVHYRKSDGKILAAETWGFKKEPSLLEGADALLEVDSYLSPEEYYVERGKAVPKKKMDTGFHVEGLIITFPKIPENTKVLVGKHELITDEESTVFEFDLPGRYRFEFTQSPQHLDTQLEVTLG